MIIKEKKIDTILPKNYSFLCVQSTSNLIYSVGKIYFTTNCGKGIYDNLNKGDIISYCKAISRDKTFISVPKLHKILWGIK